MSWSCLTNRPALRMVMEACGSAHHWARVLQAQGHQVRLLPARDVRPYVRGNKDDDADDRAASVRVRKAG